MGHKGIAVTDRYVVYAAFGHLRQLCLEHLRRNFLSLVDLGGEEGLAALRCESALRRVLVAYREREAGRLDDERYHRVALRCRRRIEAELGSSWQQEGVLLHGELKELLYVFLVEPELVWRFVDDERVPPTNNQAERDVRTYVVKRKVSLHTWSERGNRFLERALTVAGTCQKQGRSAFAFFLESISALRRGMLAPRLVPP